MAPRGEERVLNESTTQPQVTGDATGGIIPYKNPPALIAVMIGVSVMPK